MESSGAVWVRVGAEGLGAVEGALASLPRGYALGVLRYEPGEHSFALVDRWGKSDDVPRFVDDERAREPYAALSATVGEVVAYYDIEEGSELATVLVWRDGALARRIYWADGEWCEVEGEPEAWEAGLFTPERRDRAFEYREDDEAAQAVLREAFARGVIEQGARGPEPWAPALWSAIRAPAPGFSPWPRRRDVLNALPK